MKWPRFWQPAPRGAPPDLVPRIPDPLPRPTPSVAAEGVRPAAAGADLGAAAIFYGRSPAAPLAAKIRCPVRGFYGASDRPINEGVPAFADAMKQAGASFEAQVYEGAGHAFFNDGRTSYRAAAARDAFARVLELFRRELAA